MFGSINTNNNNNQLRKTQIANNSSLPPLADPNDSINSNLFRTYLNSFHLSHKNTVTQAKHMYFNIKSNVGGNSFVKYRD